VSLVNSLDEPMFEATAFEHNVYLVEAVMRSTSDSTIAAAAYRIDALLDYQDLLVLGYQVSMLRRIEPTQRTVVDTADPSVRWQRRGGRYEVIASQ
jgi:hypothetical protein